MKNEQNERVWQIQQNVARTKLNFGSFNEDFLSFPVIIDLLFLFYYYFDFFYHYLLFLLIIYYFLFIYFRDSVSLTSSRSIDRIDVYGNRFGCLLTMNRVMK